jgi:hypothetical protein
VNVQVVIDGVGGASGTVTTTPAGTSCGTNCFQMPSGQASVQLFAHPAVGSILSTFIDPAGHSCSDGCTVNLPASGTVQVTARFAPDNIHNAAVGFTMLGTGTGQISTSPGGVSCGSNCLAYAGGASVTLNAAPDLGSRFAGFYIPGVGLCADGCQITAAANSSTQVYIVYNDDGFGSTMVVLKLGDQSSGVFSIDDTLDCGATCMVPDYSGSMLEVSASGFGVTFQGWDADCAGSGTGACKVDMSADRLAVAIFGSGQPSN